MEGKYRRGKKMGRRERRESRERTGEGKERRDNGKMGEEGKRGKEREGRGRRSCDSGSEQHCLTVPWTLNGSVVDVRTPPVSNSHPQKNTQFPQVCFEDFAVSCFCISTKRRTSHVWGTR